MKYALVSITSIALGFLVGAYYGFSNGQRDSLMLEQIAQGALAVYYLNDLESGRSDSLKHSFELNIDSALDRFHRYKHGELSPLAEQFLWLEPDRLDQYVALMADYRDNNPVVFSPDWAKPSDADDEQTADWREEGYEDSVQMIKNIKSVLESRGVTSSP